MNIHAIRTQSNRVGSMVLVTPSLLGVGIAAFGWGLAHTWPATRVATLVYGLAQIYVLCASLCATVALTGDRLVELQESTPMGFRSVQTIRFGLVLLSTFVGCFLMYAPLHVLHLWPGDDGWLSVLRPGGAALMVMMTAILVATFTGLAPAVTVATVAAWVFLTMLWDPYVVPLYLQRGIPFVISMMFFLTAWRRLADSERNITRNEVS